MINVIEERIDELLEEADTRTSPLAEEMAVTIRYLRDRRIHLLDTRNQSVGLIEAEIRKQLKMAAKVEEEGRPMAAKLHHATADGLRAAVRILCGQEPGLLPVE